MKKLVTLLLSCLLLPGLLSGCASTPAAQSPTPPTETAPTPSAEPQPIKLYVIRHGKTEFNTLGRVQGWCDSLLTDVGQEQADAAGRGMSDIPFVLAYSSDLGRHRETAQRVLAQNKNDIPALQELIGLREENFGGFEGAKDPEMWGPVFASYGLEFGQFPELFQNMDYAKLTDTFAALDETGKAETFDALCARLDPALKQIIADAEASGGGNVLVSTSGSLIGNMLQMLDPTRHSMEEVKNCSVTVLSYTDGKLVLEDFNNKTYMEKGTK